jgi:hypothetical protein
VVLVVEAGEGLGDDEKPAVSREGASLAQELRGELAIAVKEKPDVVQGAFRSAQGEIAGSPRNLEVVALGLHRHES